MVDEHGHKRVRIDSGIELAVGVRGKGTLALRESVVRGHRVRGPCKEGATCKGNEGGEEYSVSQSFHLRL